MSRALVAVATVVAAHGVRGLVKIACHLTDDSMIAPLNPLTTADGRDFSLTIKGVAGPHFLAALSGVDDRDAAAALRGTTLHAPRHKLPPVPQGTYYYADLEGLAVRGVDGRPVGTVAAVHNFGAGTVLDIARDHGKNPPPLQTGKAKNVLFPFNAAFVPVVNVAEGFLMIDPPDDWWDEPEDDQPHGDVS